MPEKEKRLKRRTKLRVVYVLAVTVLALMLVILYRNWQEKGRQFELLRQEAAAQEVIQQDIRSRKPWNTELPESDSPADSREATEP